MTAIRTCDPFICFTVKLPRGGEVKVWARTQQHAEQAVERHLKTGRLS